MKSEVTLITLFGLILLGIVLMINILHNETLKLKNKVIKLEQDTLNLKSETMLLRYVLEKR